MRNLVGHARVELQRNGQAVEDPEFTASLIAAVEEFATYGHSGASNEIGVRFSTDGGRTWYSVDSPADLHSFALPDGPPGARPITHVQRALDALGRVEYRSEGDNAPPDVIGEAKAHLEIALAELGADGHNATSGEPS